MKIINKSIILNIIFLVNVINSQPPLDKPQTPPKNLEETNINLYFKKLKPIFFELWNSNVKNMEDLNENAETAVKILNEIPVFKIVILGESGPIIPKYFTSQMLLSLKRSDVIKMFFIKKGIPENRIISLGIGPQNKKITPEEEIEEHDKGVKVNLFFATDL